MMPNPELPQSTPGNEKKDGEKSTHQFRSLKELIDFASGKEVAKNLDQLGDSGLAEPLPFPFLAIVGQQEMKLALILGLINPNVSGILLIGPRGTGKTTAVRSLLDLLPQTELSSCYYGCIPEDVETSGIDAVCPDCAKKYAEGQPLTKIDRVRLVELPLNSRIDDVVGGVDERAFIHERMRIRRGILAQADKNLLYIDEINLLSNDIIDAILDAAAQGRYTVRRGPVSATYRSRFVLIGSMNPEEGKLRPQILDRFGLRVIIRGLESTEERLEAYHRVNAYLTNPRAMINMYSSEINDVCNEILEARKRLIKVTIPDILAKQAIQLIQNVGIDSLRAEITWFESARAYTAADGRLSVTQSDLTIVAPMALRLRRSNFMNNYFDQQKSEEGELKSLLENMGNNFKSNIN